MIGMAAPDAAVFALAVTPRPTPAAAPGASDEAAALGRAIKNLREGRGMSQEDLAARLGVERQTISRYESGRTAVLRTDVQRQVAAALGVSTAELMSERDNVVRPDFPRAPPPAPSPPRAVVPVHAHPEIDDDGRLHYVEVPPLSSEDLSWLFGPAAGFIRLAEGALADGAVNARLAGFDRTAWPRRGQGCVIETRAGELLPRIYQRRTEAGVVVIGGDEGEETLPSNKIKGVYAIRFWAD